MWDFSQRDCKRGGVRGGTERREKTGEPAEGSGLLRELFLLEQLVSDTASVLYVNDTNYYATYSSIPSRQFRSFSSRS